MTVTPLCCKSNKHKIITLFLIAAAYNIIAVSVWFTAIRSVALTSSLLTIAKSNTITYTTWLLTEHQVGTHISQFFMRATEKSPK